MNIYKSCRILLVLFLSIMIFFGLVSLIFLIYVVQCPYPLDMVDGAILLDGKLFAEGKGIYRDPELSPHIFAIYTPLYYMFLAFLVKLFGITFIPAKIFTLIFTVLVIITIYKIIFCITGDRLWSLMFSIVFLIQPETLVWGGLVRGDILALLFSLLAVYQYLKNPPKLSVTSFFLALSYFTKQSFFIVFVAIFVHLLIQCKKREIFKLLGLYMLPVLSVIFVLDVATGGRYFFCTFTFHCIVGLDLFAAKIHTYYYIKYHIILIILAIIALIFFLLLKKVNIGSKEMFIVVYFISTVFLSVGIIRKGAWTNQFLELNAALVILVACFFSSLFQEAFSLSGKEISFRIKKQRFFAFFSLILMLVQIFWILGNTYLYSMSISIADSVIKRKVPPSIAEVISQDGEAIRVLKTFHEPIWCENIGLLLLAGKEIFVGDPMMFSVLPANLWDRGSMVRLFREKKFSVVFLGERDVADLSIRLAPDFRAELDKNYQLVQRIGPYYLFVPND